MEEVLPLFEAGSQGPLLFFYIPIFTHIFAKAALGKISYTSDIWSSDNLTSYIAITAHWMCKDESGHLQLKNALISFQRVWGKHTASNLARVVLQLLDRAGTTTNVHSCLFFLLSIEQFDPLVRPFHIGQYRN
jgi:hypothetical protein